MKKLVLLFSLSLFSQFSLAQSIPVFPMNISFGSAEVWGDSIYYFGGSNDYGGSILYHNIYKYDGTAWSFYDGIPFNHVWGISTAIKGDSVFIFCGWPVGQNKLFMYRLSTKTWQALQEAPSNSGFTSYGQTLEYYNGFLYAFYNGYVLKYNIATNTWSSGQTLSHTGSFQSSTIYNNEFYIAGWSLSKFYKYNPVSNQWIELQSLPAFRSGGTLRVIDDKIYYAGGYESAGAGNFQTVLVYNPSINQWSVFANGLSAKRAYMADILYKNNYYVIGGLNEFGASVNIVEFITNQTTDVESNSTLVDEFELHQNYPNPFNPVTKIKFEIPASTLNPFSKGEGTLVQLKVYDMLGNEVATLVNEQKPAGVYEVEFNASSLTSGIYIYKLQIGKKMFARKMSLIK